MQSGLPNVGTSCWLNSGIQVLYSLVPIRCALSAFIKSEDYINHLDLYVAAKAGSKKKNFDLLTTYLLNFYRIYSLTYTTTVRELCELTILSTWSLICKISKET